MTTNTGTLLRFDLARRIGFIAPTILGPDIFFHSDSVDIPVREFRQGMSVRFRAEIIDGRPQAVNVQKMQTRSDRR